jgi:hypothetical protein
MRLRGTWLLAALSSGSVCVFTSAVAAETIVVLPGDSSWSLYASGGSSAAITGANPGSAFGSLELTKAAGVDAFAGATRQLPLPGFGTYGNLNILSYDFFTDPANSSHRPAAIALRLYPSDDVRTFFLYWDGCDPDGSCNIPPAGSWQTANVIGRLSIFPGENGPPPDSVEDIPPDAPIVALFLDANYADGDAWHGFADNITIGFSGQSPVTYDFELPVPRGVPATVVLPGDPAWFGYASGGVSAITNANPRDGLGSLEMSRNAGPSSFAGLGRNIPPPGLGTYGNLNVYNYDWFIDPANSSHVPPNIRIRVYPFGDSRSFFLFWNGCTLSPACTGHPAGSWQTTNLLHRLTIVPAENNTPPGSLAEIPPDAPINSIYIDSNYSSGQAWHGFVDNVTIGFTGQMPITYNFEPAPPPPDLIFKSGFE